MGSPKFVQLCSILLLHTYFSLEQCNIGIRLKGYNQFVIFYINGEIMQPNINLHESSITYSFCQRHTFCYNQRQMINQAISDKTIYIFIYELQIGLVNRQCDAVHTAQSVNVFNDTNDFWSTFYIIFFSFCTI